MSAKITVTRDGPYLVEGGVPLAHQHVVTNENGESMEWREGAKVSAPERYALCRCGHSGHKPFCDSSHKKVHFDGRETAGHEPYASLASRTDGPTMQLDDAESLCAYARFCDVAGSIWNLVKASDEPGVEKLVEHEATHCPSGRLVARKRSDGKPIEPPLAPSIGLVQDTAEKVSGPLWVRGGIPVIDADGVPYETRHRVTLCRCGASSNKPFCDGSHASIHFRDDA